jgi:hypothetical protein
MPGCVTRNVAKRFHVSAVMTPTPQTGLIQLLPGAHGVVATQNCIESSGGATVDGDGCARAAPPRLRTRTTARSLKTVVGARRRDIVDDRDGRGVGV